MSVVAIMLILAVATLFRNLLTNYWNLIKMNGEISVFLKMIIFCMIHVVNIKVENWSQTHFQITIYVSVLQTQQRVVAGRTWITYFIFNYTKPKF